jgi:arylsulfatase A-like enzyme
VKKLRNDESTWDDAHRLFWAAVDESEPRTVAFVARLYDAGIRHMDETTLRPLLDDLRDYGLERDTLVVFTSDHGEAFLEHGRFLHDDLHGETLHVPLVLRFPGRVPAGTRVTAPARLLDVMPTILDLLGVPAPPGSPLQGRSLAALARGSPGAAEATDVVSEFSSTAHGRTYASLRRDGSTYIVDGGREAFFEDAEEQADHAAERAAEVTDFRAALARWRAACEPLAARLGPRGEPVAPRDENVRRLRALGYVN